MGTSEERMKYAINSIRRGLMELNSAIDELGGGFDLHAARLMRISQELLEEMEHLVMDYEQVTTAIVYASPDIMSRGSITKKP